MPKAEDVWRNRHLLFLGTIIRMDPYKYQRCLLTSTCSGKINRGGPFINTRDSFVDGLKLLIKDSD